MNNARVYDGGWNVDIFSSLRKKLPTFFSFTSPFRFEDRDQKAVARKQRSEVAEDRGQKAAVRCQKAGARKEWSEDVKEQKTEIRSQET